MKKINKLLSEFVDIDNLNSDQIWKELVSPKFKSKYKEFKEKSLTATKEEVSSYDNQLVFLFNELHDLEELEEAELEEYIGKAVVENKKQDDILTEKIATEKKAEEERLSEKTRIDAEIKLSQEKDAKRQEYILTRLSNSEIKASDLAELGYNVSSKRFKIEIADFIFILTKKIGYKIYKIQKIKK